jgi:hypothetical protein
MYVGYGIEYVNKCRDALSAILVLELEKDEAMRLTFSTACVASATGLSAIAALATGWTVAAAPVTFPYIVTAHRLISGVNCSTRQTDRHRRRACLPQHRSCPAPSLPLARPRPLTIARGLASKRRRGRPRVGVGATRRQHERRGRRGPLMASSACVPTSAISDLVARAGWASCPRTRQGLQSREWPMYLKSSDERKKRCI